jgi:hypothetical protein
MLKHITLAILASISMGCSSHDSSSLDSQNKTLNYKIVRDNPSSPIPTSSVELQSHHFGILRPNSQAQHVFKVVNNTNSTVWKLTRITTSCACNVAKVQPDVAKPGETMQVTITYKTPGKGLDESKRIGLVFNDEETPKVWLSLQARVREALHIEPEQLQLSKVGPGIEKRIQLVVHNYSDEFWENITIQPSVKGATIEGLKPMKIEGPVNLQPRQSWTASLVAKADSLQIGDVNGEVIVRPVGSKVTPKVLPLQFEVSLPVTCAPRQIFMTDVRANKEHVYSLMLRFSDDVGFEGLSSLVLQCANSGITLKSCHKLYENCWEIHLTVLFDGTLPVVETTAELKFKHRPLLPSIKLPVYAKVEKQ